ncbi:MAG: 50S ribosomal protein L19 [Thermoguttaceae bacterium]|nr:50S ribosomal protein L19 [Thermoguttaceae bacterium]MBQ2683005.1 50S ribosomal protein L19 [Thermoguttaceae bacterium]MBQ3453544.1 50S ribosomal protein L19 [Thermoguttaceae bacterium]MBQ6619925.1 50S ribosomal protein L19 [Thermoguttaceae bacterium]MBR2585340.1 50S ribosomal protein L19 [Thermoguttaceae bacterium]
MSQEILKKVEDLCRKPEVSEFAIGDTVNVHCKILEGDKERIQIFNGVVIARSGGGTREMFVVRRIVNGEGVERKFPLHSPKIARVETVRSAIVRRAKLYFLRDRVGKKTRLAERRVERKVETEAAKPAKARRGRKAKKAAREQAKKEA